MATAKLYTDQSAITVADLLNDRVIPLFDAQGIRLHRILTDRGTECVLNMGRGKPQNHAYQLYLAVEDIPLRDQGQLPSDQRHLRTVSQDPAGRMLQSAV